MMMLCAYLALVLSGELSEVATLISFVAIGVSWIWESPRIRFERFAKMWTALTVMVFAYSLLSALAGGDVLLIGGQFLIYLTVNKLFNRRNCKDYQHIYILSFLMLVTGTVLNTQFTFGIFFLGFVVSSTWALILFHLRREMEDNFLLKHSGDQASERVQVGRILNSRRIVGKQFFVGTSAVSLSIFIGATVLFLMIPRIGFGLFFQQKRSGVHMTGFSDGVSLGGHGVIKNDDTVVMRVQIDDEFHGSNAPYVHWRGVAFDRYDRGRWVRSRRAPYTNRKVVIPSRDKTRHYLLYNDKGATRSELDEGLRTSVRQEIYLEPTGYDVLFGASRPLAFEFESRWAKPRKERNDEIRYPHSAGIKYVVYSDVREPSARTLRATSNAIPDGFDVYLDVPPEVPTRVSALAAQITEGKTTRYDKARAIEGWLKENLAYTLQMKSPPEEQDPIDFFLFDRRQGHCEYFSSAMAIMVRSQGIPSRNVNGFLGGEWNEYNDYIAVRAGDAHSWVEVYFDDVGWVTFDPTPSADLDQLGRGGGGIVEKLRRLADTIRFKWFKWVIEYDLYRQLSLFRSLSSGIKRGAASVFKAGPARIKKWFAAHKRAAIATGGAAFALLMFIAIRRRKRQVADEYLGGRRRKRRSPIALLYASACARFAKLGHKRSPSMTPREHARALVHREVPGAAELAELAEIYYGAEFGGHPEIASLDKARQLRARIGEAHKAAKAGHRAQPAAN